MSYYNSLAFNLRVRNLPEDRIVEILKEVHDVAEQSGAAPDVEFGSPQQMAERYPRQNRRTSRGAKIAGPILLLALAFQVYRFFADSTNAVQLMLTLVVMVAAIALGMMVDRRLPSGFRQTSTR